MDASTTCYYLAEKLLERRDLMVITNGLKTATLFLEKSSAMVMMPGGVLRRSAGSMVGPFGDVLAARGTIDKGFFGVKGLSVDPRADGDGHRGGRGQEVPGAFLRVGVRPLRLVARWAGSACTRSRRSARSPGSTPMTGSHRRTSPHGDAPVSPSPPCPHAGRTMPRSTAAPPEPPFQLGPVPPQPVSCRRHAGAGHHHTARFVARTHDVHLRTPPPWLDGAGNRRSDR